MKLLYDKFMLNIRRLQNKYSSKKEGCMGCQFFVENYDRNLRCGHPQNAGKKLKILSPRYFPTPPEWCKLKVKK